MECDYDSAGAANAGRKTPAGGDPQIQTATKRNGYAGQKRDVSIELHIYQGADGSFNLYDGAGDTYAYEKGVHVLTTMRRIKWQLRA
jgi:hypothetical protein